MPCSWTLRLFVKKNSQNSFNWVWGSKCESHYNSLNVILLCLFNSVWSSVFLGSILSGPWPGSFWAGPETGLRLFRLTHGLGLTGVAQGLASVCSVFPRVAYVCSVWSITNFGSVRSEYLLRGLSPSGFLLVLGG